MVNVFGKTLLQMGGVYEAHPHGMPWFEIHGMDPWELPPSLTPPQNFTSLICLKTKGTKAWCCTVLAGSDLVRQPLGSRWQLSIQVLLAAGKTFEMNFALPSSLEEKKKKKKINGWSLPRVFCRTTKACTACLQQPSGLWFCVRPSILCLSCPCSLKDCSAEQWRPRCAPQAVSGHTGFDAFCCFPCDEASSSRAVLCSAVLG